MTGMLASVNCLDEALLVLGAGVDIIDLKQPDQGALGALPIDEVKTIVDVIAKRVPVSATIGDLPMHAETIFTATQTMLATGVDYVKIGFFPGGDWSSTIAILAEISQANHALIAVLLADQEIDMNWVPILAQAGFKGVMLDTMDKSQGSLNNLLSPEEISRFVTLAKEQHLICGLAGSLSRHDIAPLLSFQADYLGFRGALCKAHNRTAALDKNAVSEVKQLILQTPFIKPVNTHVSEIIDHH